MKSRPIATIHSSSNFAKSFRSLPKQVKEQFEKKDEWFRDNAFDPRLRMHQLQGALKNCCAEGGSRTHKVVRPRDFESRAYASSATPAIVKIGKYPLH